jgi:hypothetical protein
MTLDRLKESIAQVVRALLPPFDYVYALQPSKVIKQDADYTLQIRPDNPALPDLVGVPVRTGIPGVRATVAPGARVLLGFENGDPRRPVAHLWESASVTKLEIDATQIVLNGGTAKVARENDPINAGTVTALGVAPGAPIVFIYTPAGGGAPVSSSTLTLSGGKITAGANGVKA